MKYNQAVEIERNARLSLVVLEDMAVTRSLQGSVAVGFIRDRLVMIRDEAQKEIELFSAEETWWDNKHSELGDEEIPF